MVAFESVFPIQLRDAQAAVMATPETTTKMAQDDVARVIKATDLSAFKAMQPGLQDVLGRMASITAQNAAGLVARAAGVTGDDYDQMLQQANVDAQKWAARHAARLVTEITETTRDDMRAVLTDAIEAGKTNSEIAADLSDAYCFSRERSMLIARTETSFAENNGTLDGWKASGMVSQKEWLPDVDPCPICLGNAAQGAIDVDATFAGGVQSPPQHPNCECTMTAVLAPE